MNFLTVATKKIEEKLGKFVLIVQIQEKNAKKNGKKSTNYTNQQNWKKQKIHWYRGIYNMLYKMSNVFSSDIVLQQRHTNYGMAIPKRSWSIAMFYFDEEDTGISSVVPIHQNTYL